MRGTAQLFGCSALAMLVASSAHASVIWRGDFSTGDISQWTSEETVAPSHLQVVSSPVPDGAKYALKVTIQQGDVIFGGNRDEVDYETDHPKEGDERFYHWQTMWPTDYQSAPYWQLFTQWHQYNNGGSPTLAFMVNGEQIMLGNNNDQYYWTAPLQRGVWHDFIVRVIWSSDATVGGVEVWYDGQHVLQFTHGATLYAGDTIYLKQGIYRKDLITFDQTVYHSGMTVATTLADVAPTVSAPGTTGSGTVTSGSGGTGSGSGTAAGGTTAGSGGDTTATTTQVGGTTATTGQTLSNGTVVKKASGCSSSGAPWAASLLVAGAWLMRRRMKSAPAVA